MRLERIIAIIMILLQKEKVTAKALSATFEVSVRTIYRDIDSINQAGIPIASLSGIGGGLWIMPEYKLDKGIFSKEDLVTILAGMGVLSSTLSSKETAITTAKIRSLIPKGLQDEVRIRSDFVSFDFSIRDGDSLKELIDTFHAAINSGRTVDFSYWSSKSEETTREIEPYKLVFMAGHWYVQSYCREKRAFRMFKLSRMWNAIITQNSFEPREIPKAFEQYSREMASRIIEIELLVDASILDKVLDVCSREHIRKVASEQYKVAFSFIEGDYDYGVLLSFGDKCECISPESVRQELKRRVLSIGEKYR